MANLYGRLQGARGEATRTGHTDIESKLETWEGSIRTVLKKDGTFEVFIGSKSSPHLPCLTGNVETREVTFVANRLMERTVRFIE